MPAGITRRDGELTEQSLRDAIATEVEAGRRPYAVVVGSTDLLHVALEILAPQDAGITDLDLLRTVMPRVAVDLMHLDSHEWELRQFEEARA